MAITPPIEAQPDRDSNPTEEATLVPFTAPVRTGLQSGQTLVTGGWETSSGRLTFIFMTPNSNVQEGTVSTHAEIIELPVALWRELGLMDFTSSSPESALSSVIEGPEAALFLETLKHSEDVIILSAPRVMTADGREASLQIGRPEGENLALNLTPQVGQDGSTIDLTVKASYSPSSQPSNQILLD